MLCKWWSIFFMVVMNFLLLNIFLDILKWVNLLVIDKMRIWVIEIMFFLDCYFGKWFLENFNSFCFKVDFFFFMICWREVLVFEWVLIFCIMIVFGDLVILIMIFMVVWLVVCCVLVIFFMWDLSLCECCLYRWL